MSRAKAPDTQPEQLTAEVDAMQRQLLAIDAEIAALTPELNEWNEQFQQARAMLEVRKMKLRLLKERRSGLQSVLKSLTVF